MNTLWKVRLEQTVVASCDVTVAAENEEEALRKARAVERECPSIWRHESVDSESGGATAFRVIGTGGTSYYPVNLTEQDNQPVNTVLDRDAAAMVLIQINQTMENSERKAPIFYDVLQKITQWQKLLDQSL